MSEPYILNVRNQKAREKSVREVREKIQAELGQKLALEGKRTDLLLAEMCEGGIR